MERLMVIITLTLVSVLEIILMLNRFVVPFELVLILLLLIIVSFMVVFIGQCTFWWLGALALAVNLLNLCYMHFTYCTGSVSYTHLTLPTIYSV